MERFRYHSYQQVEIVIQPTKDILSASITKAKYPKRMAMYYKKKFSNGKVGEVQIATSTLLMVFIGLT
jgi:hypothetical protein